VGPRALPVPAHTPPASKVTPLMMPDGEAISKPALIKKNLIFLIYKEIHNGAVAKSYMTNGLLRYLRNSSYIRKPFLIYDFATAPL
jgi:hypothetical protein